jgi:predicted TIM-barrel fold metal-dependent hydrolase
MEKPDELITYLEEPWRSLEPVIPRRLLPSGDQFHTPRIRRKGIFDESVGPDKWLEYLEKTGLEFTVLYPTAALAHGYVINPEWAVVYARAWNNYVHDKYLKRSPRFKAMAVIPMQDVPSAVTELRRAVKDLGMLGGYLPSNGLKMHLSAQAFWPVYEEAEKLDCALGLHGGFYSNLGFDTFTRFPGTRALGMPVPLAIAMTGMIQDGVWDAFPKLRVGFLEGKENGNMESFAARSRLSSTSIMAGFMSAAKEMNPFYLTSLIGSDLKLACLRPISRTRSPWKTRCTKSMKSWNEKTSTRRTKK